MTQADRDYSITLAVLRELEQWRTDAERAVFFIGRQLGDTWCAKWWFKSQTLPPEDLETTNHGWGWQYSYQLQSTLDSLDSWFMKRGCKYKGAAELRDFVSLIKRFDKDRRLEGLPPVQDLLRKLDACSSFVSAAALEMVHHLRDTIAQPEWQAQLQAAAKKLLNERQQIVLSLLQPLPRGKGLVAKELIRELTERGSECDQSTLTTHVMPLLKKWYGVANKKGIGYFLIANQGDT